MEDEAAASAREHGMDHMGHKLEIEDQAVPSRGAVDQYPVIVDSDMNTNISIQDATISFALDMASKRCLLCQRELHQFDSHAPASTEKEYWVALLA